jgi:hypothetical protein
MHRHCRGHYLTFSMIFLPKSKAPGIAIKDVLSYCNACTGKKRAMHHQNGATNNTFYCCWLKLGARNGFRRCKNQVYVV